MSMISWHKSDIQRDVVSQICQSKVQGSMCLLAITMQEACLTKDKITIQNNNTNTQKK